MIKVGVRTPSNMMVFIVCSNRSSRAQLFFSGSEPVPQEVTSRKTTRGFEGERPRGRQRSEVIKQRDFKDSPG